MKNTSSFIAPVSLSISEKDFNNAVAKRVAERVAREDYPEYNFKWVRSFGKYKYVPYERVSKTVVVNRKNINWAKAHGISIDKSTNDAIVGNEWRPCILDNAQGLHDVEDFANNYYINRDGVIAVVDDARHCAIYKPYRHNGDYYCIDFMNKGEHVNQTIRGLLRRSWGDEVANKFEILEDSGDELFVA